VATTEDDPINDKPMPLLEHLIELRTRLIWAMVAFAICFAVSYYFSNAIYYFLARPLAQILRDSGNPDPKLIYTQLYEAFFTRIKLAFFGGMFLGFPIIACQLWLFVAPGLYRSEKRALLPFLLATPVLFILGAALAYFFVFPFAWKFFASFQTRHPDRVAAESRRVSRPRNEADLRVRVDVSVAGRPDFAGEGGDHQFGRAAPVPALRDRRDVRGRRGAGAA
jgi:Sec-independent protein secretion pathway component TatC